MDLRSVSPIDRKQRQELVSCQIWWSRGERLESLRYGFPFEPSTDMSRCTDHGRSERFITGACACAAIVVIA